MLSLLPKDILVDCISRFLSPKDISRLTCTCKRFHSLFIFHPLLTKWKEPYKDINYCLYISAKKGFPDLVELFIKKGAINFNYGLYGASQGGHTHLIELFIQKGANNWNLGLEGASRGRHLHLVDFFIQKGANVWNGGLYGASLGGHLNLVKGGYAEFGQVCPNSYIPAEP
jgi:hypothetical protein